MPGLEGMCCVTYSRQLPSLSVLLSKKIIVYPLQIFKDPYPCVYVCVHMCLCICVCVHVYMYMCGDLDVLFFILYHLIF